MEGLILWLVSPVWGVRLCFNDNNLGTHHSITWGSKYIDLPKRGSKVTNNYNVTLRHSVMILLYVSVSRIHVSVEPFSKYMYREEYKRVVSTIGIPSNNSKESNSNNSKGTKKQTLLQQNEDHVDFLSRSGDCHLHPRCTQPCSTRPRATATYKSQRSHLQHESTNNLLPLFCSQRPKYKHRHQMFCLLVCSNLASNILYV